MDRFFKRDDHHSGFRIKVFELVKGDPLSNDPNVGHFVSFCGILDGRLHDYADGQAVHGSEERPKVPPRIVADGEEIILRRFFSRLPIVRIHWVVNHLDSAPRPIPMAEERPLIRTPDKDPIASCQHLVQNKPARPPSIFQRRVVEGHWLPRPPHGAEPQIE
jgi:hypothetical protein